MTMDQGLHLKNLRGGYADKAVIHDLSFDVGPQETFVLMGPSGSGKTTLFLTILGLLKPSKGEIILNGQDITSLPIEKRNIGFLPQDYGLFPHLNVFGNVAYGLRMRGIPKQEQEQTVRDMLALVGLQGSENRRVQELSGGQKQRVGLARALAVKPDLLLLDEPLSNIDQVTKGDVARELKRLFGKLGIPIILVTHSHEDAVYLSDRLAILIDGNIEQIGNVQDIIKHPKSDFIRRLLSPFETASVR